METLYGKQHYIFFLQLTSQLPQVFIYLAEEFKVWGIDLIPVNYAELVDITKGAKKHVMIYTPDLYSAKKLIVARKTIVDHLVHNKRVCLHHLTSFARISYSYQHDRMQSYFCYQMPIKAKECATLVAKQYYEECMTQNQWPGGTRAKVPTY